MKKGIKPGYEKSLRIRGIGKFSMNVIESESKRSKYSPKQGPRKVFLDKYRVTQNIDESKQELIRNGYSLDIYEDKIIDKWIQEGR